MNKITKIVSALKLRDMKDAPTSYSGGGGKIASVKATEDGIEFLNTYFENFEDLVDVAAIPGANKMLVVNATEDGIDYIDDVGATTFIGLLDAPSSYSFNGSKILRVNAAENALVFDDMISTFFGLKDVSATYSNTQIPKVNGTETGIEFANQGVSTFLALDDVDITSYTGRANNYIIVNPPIYPVGPTDMTAYRGSIGLELFFTYTGTTSGSGWGTDIYTDDSTVAKMAVHAGALNNGETGVVKITILAGQSSYTGSTRNGVTTSNYASWGGSYSVERYILPSGRTLKNNIKNIVESINQYDIHETPISTTGKTHFTIYPSIQTKYIEDRWLSVNGFSSTARNSLIANGTQSALIIALGYDGTNNRGETDRNNGNSWSTMTANSTPRRAPAGAGIQQASLAFGGYTTVNVGTTDKNNAGTWSATGACTARSGLGGCGVQNAALSFGGHNGTAYVSTTEKFNGTSWAATGSLTAIKGGLTGCGTQNAALAFGGYNGTTVFNVTEKFNGSVWVASGTLNTAKLDHAASGVQNAALSIAGSTAGAGANTAIIEKFNGNTWITLSNCLAARRVLAGAGSCNASISTGGYTTVASNITEKYFGINNISIKLDVKTNTQDNISELHEEVNKFPYSFISYGPLTLSLGINVGYGLSEEENIYLKQLGREYVAQPAWNAGYNIGIARSELGCAGTLYATVCFGGWNGSVYSAYTEKCSGGSWSASGNLNVARGGNLGGIGAQNAAVSFGGYNGTYLNTTEKFDGTAWTTSGNLNTARYRIAGAGLQNAGLSFGGYTVGPHPTTEKFNGSTWASSGGLNTARYSLAGCGVQNAALSINGNIGGVYSAVVEKFNGSSWYVVISSNVARDALAAFGIQNDAICFGGYTGSVSAVTEKFNGFGWHQIINLNTARRELSGCGHTSSGLSLGGNTGTPSSIGESYVNAQGSASGYNYFFPGVLFDRMAINYVN